MATLQEWVATADPKQVIKMDPEAPQNTKDRWRKKGYVPRSEFDAAKEKEKEKEKEKDKK